MASGDSADLLACSLCLDDFTDPRALPCLHTFCLKCLDDLTASTRSRGNKLKCPLCQEDHEIPPSGATGFRSDFRIKSLMEKTTMCKDHPNMELTYICQKKDCKGAMLCSKCVTEKHANHLIEPVKEIYKAKRNQLKLLGKAVKENRELFGKISSEIEQNGTDMKNVISAKVKKYRVMLDKLAENINREIDQTTHEQLVVFSTQEIELEKAEQQLEKLAREFNDTIPNVAKANEDNRLDAELDALCRATKGWIFKYELPTMKTSSLDSFISKGSDNVFVELKLKEKNVKGSQALEPTAPVMLEEITRWEQRDKDVMGLTCHSIAGGGVTIVSNTHIRVYKMSTGELFHSRKHGHQIGGIATIRNRCHAALGRNEVNLYYDWPLLPGKSNYSVPLLGYAATAISGTKNYLVYTSDHLDIGVPNKVHVVCFSIKNHPATLKWKAVLEWPMARSVSAMEKPNELIVLVARWIPGFVGGFNFTGLVAFDRSGESLWQISFDAFDKESGRFDLVDMSNDGRYFYVLDVADKANCVYLISTEGKVLSKVLENLFQPQKLSINAEANSMVVACGESCIEVYRLKYAAQ